MEPLWARRKVGFLLDQIRVNGEKKELIDEVVLLAKPDHPGFQGIRQS